MASIALTAVLTPSRGLRAGILLFAFVSALAALTVQFNSSSFYCPQWVAASCLFVCACALRAGHCSAKAHQIDISGLGQIRLTVQLCIGQAPAAIPGTATVPAAREVRLLPASTLWPQLLLLLLRDGGVVIPVLVLPDSLPPAAFRALACACRAIRHQAEAGKNDN